MENRDEFYMARALELARRGWGDTAPNPMVGAVMVRGGRIVGEGWHRRDGAAHAEIECLLSAGENAKGATIYVTLEPCTTRGRTGACSDALIAAQVACVKVGALDPNPVHAGRAAEIFKAAGIACEFGILKSECEDLNFIFNKSISTNRALLAIKYAISADGKIAKRRGERTQITSRASRVDLMRWRKLFSSIGVGTGTFFADNPRLTSRPSPLDSAVESCGLRLLLNSDLSLARRDDLKNFNLFSDEFSLLTRVVCDRFAPAENEDLLAARGISVLRLESPLSDSASYWDELKQKLFKMRITSLMLEGGAKIFASVNAARAADFAFEYVAPTLLNCGLDAFEGGANFEIVGAKKINLAPDTLTYGKVKYK